MRIAAIRLDHEALGAVFAGYQFRPGDRESTNVIDRRSEFTPLEDGTLYRHETGTVEPEPTPTERSEGYRDDPVTGDRTHISPDGHATSIERVDGNILPPGTAVEDGVYDAAINRTIPDPSANTALGGYRVDELSGDRTVLGEHGQSTQVFDRDGRELPVTTPTENGVFANSVQREFADPTANQALGGWRDDPDTGDRTFIDGNGATQGVQALDGSFSSPHTPVEEGLYNSDTGQVEPDFTANLAGGGYRDDPETGARTEIDASGYPVDANTDPSDVGSITRGLDVFQGGENDGGDGGYQADAGDGGAEYQ